jgi:hypothetical protein
VGEQVGRVVVDLVGPLLHQFGPRDAAAGQGDAGQPGGPRRPHVPDRVADGDRALRVQAVVGDSGPEEVGCRFGGLHVGRRRGPVDDVLATDRRRHPLQVGLLAAGRQHHGEAPVPTRGQQLVHPGEGDHQLAQRFVAPFLGLHHLVDVVRVVPQQVGDQLGAGDADRAVAVGHRDLGVTGVAEGAPPGEDLEVVGVQQRAVDVQEDAGSRSRGHRAILARGRPHRRTARSTGRPAVTRD